MVRLSTAQVLHVRRQGNRSAHLLALYARHIVNYITWIEKIPSMVELTMAHDVAILSSF